MGTGVKVDIQQDMDTNRMVLYIETFLKKGGTWKEMLTAHFEIRSKSIYLLSNLFKTCRGSERIKKK